MNTPPYLRSWIGPLAIVLALGALTSSASAQASPSDGVPPGGQADPALESALPSQDAADGAPFDPTARARELDSARASYSQLGLGGPIVLMSVSFTLAIPVTLVGLVANALGDNPTLLVAGIGLGVVGIGSRVLATSSLAGQKSRRCSDPYARGE